MPPFAGEIIEVADVACQRCRVTRTAAQSINDNTVTAVQFDAERFDNDTMHDTVTNNTRITFTTAGAYLVGFHGLFAAANDYVRCFAVLRLNGVTEIARGPQVSTSTAVQAQVAVETMYEFDAADYLEALVYQDNSAAAARNLEQSADRTPEFYATRLGA